MRRQERENEQLTDVLSFVGHIGDHSRPTAEAVARWKAQIEFALAAIYLRQQFGRQLQKRYEEILASR